jgi:hypothetical protein
MLWLHVKATDNISYLSYKLIPPQDIILRIEITSFVRELNIFRQSKGQNNIFKAFKTGNITCFLTFLHLPEGGKFTRGFAFPESSVPQL